MNRRGFLGLLGGAAVAAVVPELIAPARTIMLPPAGGWPVGDFSTENLRFRAIERFSHGFMDPRALPTMTNQLVEPQELTERMIEDMLIELHTQRDSRGLMLHPSQIKVPPHLAEHAARLTDPMQWYLKPIPGQREPLRYLRTRVHEDDLAGKVRWTAMYQQDPKGGRS